MPFEIVLPEQSTVPPLEDNLNAWRERIDQVEAEAVAGSNQFPAWWNEGSEQLRSIVPQLKR